MQDMAVSLQKISTGVSQLGARESTQHVVAPFKLGTLYQIKPYHATG